MRREEPQASGEPIYSSGPFHADIELIARMVRPMLANVSPRGTIIAE